jgi:hypothetical protein
MLLKIRVVASANKLEAGRNFFRRFIFSNFKFQLVCFKLQVSSLVAVATTVSMPIED